MQQLTTKQEAFATLLLDPDHTYTSAYREAYDVGEGTPDDHVYVMASKVANHVKVRQRVQELRQEAYQNGPYTLDRLRSKLELRSDDAAEAGQYGPSIRALELVGKLDGLIVDRKDIQLSGGVVVGHVELSTDELRQVLADGQRIADAYRLEDSTTIDAKTLPGDPKESKTSSS